MHHAWLEQALSTADLFTAGLGIEIVGGVLLAQAALARPDEIAQRLIESRVREVLEPLPPTIPTEEAEEVARQAKAAAQARLGVQCLVLGFVLQLVGYVLTTAHGSSHASVERGLVSVIPCLLIGGIAWWAAPPYIVDRGKKAVVFAQGRLSGNDREAMARLCSYAPIYSTRRERLRRQRTSLAVCSHMRIRRRQSHPRSNQLSPERRSRRPNRVEPERPLRSRTRPEAAL
jgi:hypothetical protein